MTSTPDRTESVFAAAVALPVGERAAYLDQACTGDAALRGHVEALIRAHERAGHILDRPAPATPEQTGVYLPDEQPGAVIAGRYKLLEAIGEGGMGTVWVAEQTQPVRRKVALKLIKAGMDSRSVIARFEAERQALALMDHPNVAKVLDGGLTEAGRPFFVMEYVKGVPITEYCDATKLSVPERLQLFTQVCQAVQHAHQKGIIHRDLKPSNILVAPYDDTPVPKIIDFGLAKAMHQSLTEKTLHTAHDSVLGTPLYMSPEQAQLNNLDVDTRSDIYSLGVLLYELLTGTTPLEKARFKQAAWDEIRRIIREEEPPRPSARLSTTQTLLSLAACRQTEPLKLTKQVRGELDWIVMKALEKDRARRYETANALAKDVQRFLSGDSVEACPPRMGYRLRKFIRKNRTLLITAGAFAGLLLASAAVSGWLAVQARRAEAIAEERRIEADSNAKEAESNAGAANKTANELERVLFDAQVRFLGLKVDLDLAELRTDPRIGLLRLAHPLKDTFEIRHFGPNYEGAGIVTIGSAYPPLLELRQFVTAAALAAGQNYASLLPPMTHDGAGVAHWQIDSTGGRLVTLGNDGTARLWNARTARPVATLRRSGETAIHCGLSPDGRMAFTDAADGIVRLWDTSDGAYRAQTEPRPERICAQPTGDEDAAQRYLNQLRKVNQISNDRVLTRSIAMERDESDRDTVRLRGPVELWDSGTGRLVARLDDTNRSPETFRFTGDGRWASATEGTSNTVMFSAIDGGVLATLKHPPEQEDLGRLYVGPRGDTVVTIAQKIQKPGIPIPLSDWYIHQWNPRSWNLASVTGPCPASISCDFTYLCDRTFALDGFYNGPYFSVRIFGGMTIYASKGYPEDGIAMISPNRDRALLENGKIMDTRTWQRVLPPSGRKYPDDFGTWAKDGRFVYARRGGGALFIDVTTEKAYESPLGNWEHFPDTGWTAVVAGRYGCEIQRLPKLDQLDFPPAMIDLWAQVAVRGELGPPGEFVEWDEPTWEKKRQELAAMPALKSEFPFPGYVATDRLHWLRSEFATRGPDTEKLRLATELLRRAEESGDSAEAVRWRAEKNRLSQDVSSPAQENE
jgi:hypothetical protein